MKFVLGFSLFLWSSVTITLAFFLAVHGPHDKHYGRDTIMCEYRYVYDYIIPAKPLACILAKEVSGPEKLVD